MKRGIRCGSRIVAALTCAAFALATGAPAWAYNHAEHQNVVDVAYQAMRVAQFERFYLNQDRDLDDDGVDEIPALTPFAQTPPAGATQEQWAQFLADLTAAFPALLALDAGIPPPKPSTLACGVAFCRGTLGEVDFAPSTGYMGAGANCDDVSQVRSNSLLNQFADTRDTDFVGKVLGLHAARVDDEVDDTHLWFRLHRDGITSTVPGGSAINEVHKRAEQVSAFVLAILLLPFVCLYEAIAGTDGSCWDRSLEVAEMLQPSGLEDLIPGVGDLSGPDYVGLWHFLHLDVCATNHYDDTQGMLYSEAGPNCKPGALDVAISVAGGELLGVSLDYQESNGPKRYRFVDDDDGHFGLHRTEGQWQDVMLGLLPFSPLDNLAFYGWSHFRTERSAKWLAWPLHALGDASVPMHVIGTTGHGHRPYEDATSRFWNEILGGGTNHSSALEVMHRAVPFRQMILDWRVAHPGRAFDNDVPIRDLVMMLAQKTRDNVNATPSVLRDNLSTDYQTGTAAGPTEAYHDTVDFQREQLLQSAGAILAFLMSATELPPATLPDPGPLPAQCTVACFGNGTVCGTSARNPAAPCCAPATCVREGDGIDRCTPPAPPQMCTSVSVCTGPQDCCAPAICQPLGDDPTSLRCQTICGGFSCTSEAQCCPSDRCDAITHVCTRAASPIPRDDLPPFPDDSL